jgi:transcription factor IIIB 90 kDa subunit
MPRPLPTKPVNPLRNRREIVAPTALVRKATAGAAAARPAKRACPNKQCSNPQVEDGICHNCGTIVDDSNIVAEIQFGENSSGAAVVQGSFLGADQGTAKSLGPAFRRAGGEEGREATVREGELILVSGIFID